MNSLELTSAVTTLANAISCKLSVDEITLLATVFVQLGDTLATITTQRNLCEQTTEEKLTAAEESFDSSAAKMI